MTALNASNISNGIPAEIAHLPNLPNTRNSIKLNLRKKNLQNFLKEKLRTLLNSK